MLGWVDALVGVAIVVVLPLVAANGLLAFHGLAEILAAAFGFSVFLVAWTARPAERTEAPLLVLGAGLLAVGAFDVLHALAYPGAAVLAAHGGETAAQLLLAARLIEVATFLAVVPAAGRTIPPGRILAGFLAVSLGFGVAILGIHRFPDCLLPGGAPTAFLRGGELAVDVGFVAAMLLLWRGRTAFENSAQSLLLVVVAARLLAELSFSILGDSGVDINLSGHLLKVAAFYGLFRIAVFDGIRRPREEALDSLRESHDQLEAQLRRQSDELAASLLAVEAEVAQRRQAETQLNHSIAALERSNAELEQFAYIASHDLQEPLRMVISFSQLLARRYAGKLDSEGEEFIAYAVEGAKRMQKMILDLLDYSRVVRRGGAFTWFAAVDAVDAALANLGVVVGEAGALVEVGDLPTVLADRGQLERLFQHLIANALKYRRPNVQPTLRITGTEIDEGWRFAVADNGIGIEEQYFDRIFQVFQRLHNRTAYPGTGIGLAICKKTVERHGGRIWVTSEPGRGSTVLFILSNDPPPGGGGAPRP